MALLVVDGATFNVAVNAAGTVLGVKIGIPPPPTMPTATNVDVNPPSISAVLLTAEAKKALINIDWTTFLATFALTYITTIFNTTPGVLGPVGNVSVPTGLATKTTTLSGTPVILDTTTFALTMLVVTPAIGPGPAFPTDVVGNSYGFDVTITNANQTKYTSV